jgi:uncharacterized protein YjbI with pentapeptide repeats
LKPSEPKAILKDHRLWVESCGKQGCRADLRDVYLRRADLRCANLRNASLQDAYLQGANLRCANLRNASLRNASLRGADLEGADLVGANLRDADLVGANLRGACLEDANLGGAKFTTNFKNVGWFKNATFSEDQIPWVVLHPKYPHLAHTLKWVKAEADAA